MNTKTLAAVALALACAAPAFAGPAANNLIACLSDSTSGKDRKLMARWLFASMAAHPEMKDISSATAAAHEDASRQVGQLFTRLLSEACPTQFRTAMATEGPESLGMAFESLGKLAMQELMANNEVRTSLGTFQNFVDRRKVEGALGPLGLGGR